MILESRRSIKIFALSICLWIQTHTAETNAFAIISLPSLHNVPESITDTAKNASPLGRRVSASTSRIKYNAFNQHINRHRQTQSRSRSQALFAHAGNDKRNKSNTTREAAVIVEWEPVTLSELERRIGEGINYKKSREKEGDIHEDRHQGIFCGYKVTKEEVSRLKSANPDDYSP